LPTFVQKAPSTRPSAKPARHPRPGGKPSVTSDRHHAVGNRAVERLLTGIDAHEREAQRVAERPSGRAEAAPRSVDRALATPGSALEPALRREMEHSLGDDFSGVRVHFGPAADRSARDVGARAYTVGHDVVFGAGRFAPRTSEGRRLIAHELTHVMQQSRTAESRPSAMLQRQATSAPTGPSPKAPEPSLGQLMRLDQTVAIKGDPMGQDNYVDRAINRVGSAPLIPHMILFPRTDTSAEKGISVLKGDFHVDDDPLSGTALAHNQVYRSQEVAQAVMADLDRRRPDIRNYAFYLRDGIIFPTVLSDTTIPKVMALVRARREQDIKDAEATRDTAIAIALWYAGARFPIKTGKGGGAAPTKEVVKETGKGAGAVKAVFDAAKVADELLAATKTIANAGQRMLAAARQLSRMRDLSAAQKVEVMLEFFKRINFAISKAGVADEGAQLVMYSEDSRYAFAFIKETGEILYGKFNMETLKYVWEILK
jgi:hypothetical protein